MSRFWLHGLMFIFVPNLCYVILDISMAIGFVLTCLAGLLLEIKTILRKSYKSKSLLMISLLFVFVVIWGVYYLLVNGEAKPLLSALIFIPIIYALLVAEILLLANDQQVNDFLASLGMLTFILLALGWAKLIFDLGLGAYAEYPKSLFPFSEDSHFALTLAIFSLGYICGSPQGSILSALVLINILVFGLFLPSLILIILFLIGISIYFLRMGSMVKWGYFIVLIIFSSAGLDFLISFDYFASRLNTEN